MKRPGKLRLFDAVVCLALAERLHGEAATLKRVARRLMERLPKHLRGALAPIIATHDPHMVVRNMLRALD